MLSDFRMVVVSTGWPSFIEWTCYLFSMLSQSYYLSSLVSWRCVLLSDRASSWTPQSPVVEQGIRLCSLKGRHH